MNEFVRVIIERDGRFLVIKEQWSDGIHWVFPGGKVDELDTKNQHIFIRSISADGFDTRPFRCALVRELREETGMKVEAIHSMHEHKIIVKGIEWTGFYYRVEASGLPQILEPHKCLGMQWATPAELFRLPCIEGTLDLEDTKGNLKKLVDDIGALQAEITARKNEIKQIQEKCFHSWTFDQDERRKICDTCGKLF